MGNHLRSVAGYFTMPWMFGSASYIPSWRYISEYGEKDTVYDYACAAGGRRRPAGLFEMRRWRDGQSQLRPVGRTAGCRGGNAVSGRAGRSKDNVQYLAWVDGQIDGDASLNRKPRRMSHRGEFVISLRKAYWGCGVASALMEAVLAFAVEKGFEQINLEVRSDNLRAIRVYEKFVFCKLI